MFIILITKMENPQLNRGAFIVIEGIDRSGKTTQSKLLVDKLCSHGISSTRICFPDRSTAIGKVIHEYLVGNIELTSKAIHLLFSANRWEVMKSIEEFLLKGITVVCDRYAYSGVAYTVATGNASLEWCKHPDKGLIKPDILIYFYSDPAALATRAEYGNEKYDNIDFQRKVKEQFSIIIEPPYFSYDALLSKEELSKIILYDVLNNIKNTPERINHNLWM